MVYKYQSCSGIQNVQFKTPKKRFSGKSQKPARLTDLTTAQSSSDNTGKKQGVSTEYKKHTNLYEKIYQLISTNIQNYNYIIHNTERNHRQKYDTILQTTTCLQCPHQWKIRQVFSEALLRYHLTVVRGCCQLITLFSAAFLSYHLAVVRGWWSSMLPFFRRTLS